MRTVPDRQWTASNRVQLFQFDNHEDALELHLIVGPGPAETRRVLIERADAKSPPFRRRPSKGKKWTEIYEKPFLRHDEFAEVDIDDVKRRVQGK